MAHSAKADSVLWPIAQNELKFEYLGEIEVIFEMALGNESGNQMGSIHEKNQGTRWVQFMKKTRGKKSRETIPLCAGLRNQSCNVVLVKGALLGRTSRGWDF